LPLVCATAGLLGVGSTVAQVRRWPWAHCQPDARRKSHRSGSTPC